MFEYELGEVGDDSWAIFADRGEGVPALHGARNSTKEDYELRASGFRKRPPLDLCP